ncbi:MAG TPA: Fur family transcriptional regulator [Thermodesulfatator atlanticus]|uniref:Ferric uptake regulation protein n=1 Tax=Thermodesulfatator atlanticus TaxID=501497 RepID=A0A7V5U2Z6_9BACT|nr:Fur family transcriptional regulator [Thermodesulfatator atlanticus]
MKNHAVHQKEKENFLKLAAHLPHPKRELFARIFEAFLETEEHVSLEDFQKILREKGLSVTKEELKEALELFCRLGFAQRKEFIGQPPVYEHRHLGEHHDHLICTRCGRIQEFYLPKLEALQEEIARQYGFKSLDHRLEIYGLCAQCQATRAKPALPLTLVSAGEKVRVERFLGGSQALARLAAMGLTVGEELEVINNCGPIIVSVRGARLAIGQGLAHKILVSPLD